MSKRKGLSFDEKKATLVAAMEEEAAFYTLKELESLGKSKGVIPQAVKEVVEGLCADGDVQTDKVGSQVLFWALPSQKIATLSGKRQRLQEEAQKLEKEHETLEAELAAVPEPPPSEQEVAELRAQAARDRKHRDGLQAQVEACRRGGAGQLTELGKQTVVAKEAANRWADNVCVVRSQFLRERRGEVSSKQFNQSFGLPEDFEPLE
mmetsp:Transcript_22194/g.66183  ORF Transcript_22194/g.66183 Transcript_22194/m.66183 type:complete len:207 (-) Transcript_22194:296-916(-)